MWWLLMGVYNHWTRPVDWTGGLDWWTGDLREIYMQLQSICAQDQLYAVVQYY